MFPAGAVLGEEAGPVLAGAGDVVATLPLDTAYLVGGAYSSHRCGARVDEAGPGVGAGDAEEIDAPPVEAYVAVSKVEAQQIGIRGRFVRCAGGVAATRARS